MLCDQRSAIDGKLGFSLKKDYKYEFLIEIKPSSNELQTFSTIIQQDNWAYIPEGCLVTGKHTDDLYLCDDALKIIADRDGTSMFRQSEWEKNKKTTDFSGNLADNITDTIYASNIMYRLNLIDGDKYVFELCGDISTVATYGGLLSMPVKALNPVGSVLTVVGAVSTYISSYAISKDDFNNNLKNCFLYLDMRNDKSIVIKHQNFLREKVNVEPWIDKFVNKYDEKGEKLTINALTNY